MEGETEVSCPLSIMLLEDEVDKFLLFKLDVSFEIKLKTLICRKEVRMNACQKKVFLPFNDGVSMNDTLNILGICVIFAGSEKLLGGRLEE